MHTTLNVKYLKEWLDDLWNILVDLNISINNAKRLTEDKYEYDKDSKQYGFFQHHWYQLKFIMIVQLCKLLSRGDNEKRSYWKLCNRLEHDKYEFHLRQLLRDNSKKQTNQFNSKKDIKEHCQIVRKSLKDKSHLIERIVDARDQIYAHKDENPQVSSIQMADLSKLIDLAVQIYNDISFKLFFKSSVFDTQAWSIDLPLWYISEYRKLDQAELERKIKGKSS